MANNKTITAANAIILLTIDGVYPVPVQLQGFAAENIFDIPGIVTAESQMGVDGRLSAGWVPNPVVMTISLQADSDSVLIFENWYAVQQSDREVHIAQGSVTLTSVNRKYNLRRGVLTNWIPTPAAQRVLQPRAAQLTWQSITSAPV
jgi:hypothetical protein